MTAFDTMFARGFRRLLATHGEPVTWMPMEGAAKDITALVTRQDIQPIDGLEGPLAPLIMLEALDNPRDADYGGIDPARTSPGRDEVRLAVKQGGPLEIKTVTKRIPSDGGVVRFEIR